MNDRLNSQDLSALFTLMAVAQEIDNTTLAETTGIRITGDVRKRLNGLGLVTSTREGNKPYVHELTKDGWLRARAEFTAERPARPGYYGYAFFALLNGLDRFLNRESRPVEDLFQPDVTGPGVDGLETQIKRAYHKLAPKPGDWVHLAKLRPLLNGASKDEVDAVLKVLGRKQDVTLAPNPNRKVVTADDRAAAVLIGGDENHLIAIEES
jgi:DNA-binding transcriptional ArsR family regulator